jgi:hypothetical protein
MLAKLARTYVYSVLIVEGLSLTASILLHISALTEIHNIFTEQGQIVLIGPLLAACPVLSLAKERNVWKHEFKDCPWWMRDIAIASSLYGLMMMILGIMIRSDGSPVAGELVSIPAFQIGFEVMGLCIIYSVLWSGSLSEQELIKRARTSIILTITIAALCLASRAGFLSHRGR